MRGLISTNELSAGELSEIFNLAERGKKSNWKEFSAALAGKVCGLLFFDPSLRTRASLQSGIAKLGGGSVAMNAGADTWKLEFGEGAVMDKDTSEHVKEAAGVLSSYFDLLGVRAFPGLKSFEEDKKDTVLKSFTKYSKVPVLNLESSMWHPCQALADGFTLRERFGARLKGKRFLLIWANHPRQLPMAVPNSTLTIAAQVGCNVRLACPEGYELDSDVLHAAQNFCEQNGTKLEVTHAQRQAFNGVDVVYAKSWTPPRYVGRVDEEKEHRKTLSHWMVTEELMGKTENGVFMHCLPVRRNVVVADGVLDSSRSIVQSQAANRLHAQNGFLVRSISNS